MCGRSNRMTHSLTCFGGVAGSCLWQLFCLCTLCCLLDAVSWPCHVAEPPSFEWSLLSQCFWPHGDWPLLCVCGRYCVVAVGVLVACVPVSPGPPCNTQTVSTHKWPPLLMCLHLAAVSGNGMFNAAVWVTSPAFRHR